MSPSEAPSVIVAEESTASAVWPWQAEPYKLWSLLDMLVQFNSRDFGAFLTNFERACAYTEMILSPPAPGLSVEGLLKQAIPRYRDALLGLMKICMDGNVKLSQSVGLQIGRLAHRLENEKDFDYASLVAEARVTRQLLLDDLSQHAFFTVPSQYRELFEQKEPPFGALVEQVFGDAKRDIEAASRCLALSEWTASVFHSMRVLEHDLRPMAKRFDVPFKTDPWHAVLKGIEDGIAGLRNKRGLTEQDREEITRYSEAASQFRHFKDAWRKRSGRATPSNSATPYRAVPQRLSCPRGSLGVP